MQEYFNRIREQITQYWSKLSGRNKIQIISAVVIGIVALVVMTFILSRPTFVVIKNDINPEDMSQIQTELMAQGIEYKISSDASTLSVDENKQQDAVMVLATLGVVSDAPFTYEEALNAPITATQSERELRAQLAFEDEINRNIEALSQVRNAYVKFYIGDDATALFDDVRPSSATLTLDLVGDLDGKAISGIVSMLRNAVPNLDDSNISIISTDGVPLYDGASSDSIGGSVTTRLEYEEQHKNSIRTDLSYQLLKIGQYDDVAINMTLDIDFDKEKSVESDYEQGPVSSETTTESSSSNTDDGGVPGTDTNDGNVTTYDTDGSSSSSSNDTYSYTEYDSDLTVTERESMPGAVNYSNSSITVVLNEFEYIYEEDIEEQGLLADMSWEKYIEENDTSTQLEVSEDIEDLITTGSNISNAQVLAYRVPLFISKEPVDFQVLNYLPIAIIIILIGLLVFAVIRGTEPMEVEETDAELSVEEMLESTKDKQTYEDIEFDDKSDIRKQIERFVDKNPDAVANLLRNWINEDWD